MDIHVSAGLILDDGAGDDIDFLVQLRSKDLQSIEYPLSVAPAGGDVSCPFAEGSMHAKFNLCFVPSRFVLENVAGYGAESQGRTEYIRHDRAGVESGKCLVCSQVAFCLAALMNHNCDTDQNREARQQ